MQVGILNLIKNHIKPTLGAFDINEIDTACIQRFIADKSINGKKDGSGGLSSKRLYDLLLVIKETLAYVEEYYHKANYIDYKKLLRKPHMKCAYYRQQKKRI